MSSEIREISVRSIRVPKRKWPFRKGRYYYSVLKSIQKDGLLHEIVIDTKFRLVDGLIRLEAMKELRHTKIQVLICSLK